MDKVIVKSVQNYEYDAVYASIKEIMIQGELQKLVKDTSKILIKPNMLSKNKPENAVTTNPMILDCVIGVLNEFGALNKNITVADSSGGPSNSKILQSNYRVCGFTDITEKHKVNLYTELEGVKVKTDGILVKEFEIIKPAVESDIIINLPKFKTHVMTGMTGAVKNLFGVVPGLKKAEFHMRFPEKENFSNMIVDLCETIKPEFTIVDGIFGMEGDGPSGGQIRNFGLLIGGTNPYNIDLYISHIMGFKPEELPILSSAIKRGLCSEEFNNDMILGNIELCNPIENFLRPNSYSVDFSDKMPRAIRWATPSIERLLAPKPKINRNICIGCGKCRDICPQHTIEIKDKKAYISRKGCIKCFCCHEMCPEKAIEIKHSIFFNI